MEGYWCRFVVLKWDVECGHGMVVCFGVACGVGHGCCWGLCSGWGIGALCRVLMGCRVWRDIGVGLWYCNVGCGGMLV